MSTRDERDPDVTWVEADLRAAQRKRSQVTIGFDGEPSEEVPRPDDQVLHESPRRYQPAGREGGVRGPTEPASILGAGGLGIVLAVHDRYLGREVALKELHPSITGTVAPGSAERFLREARVTAQLQHPSIVPVHEIGRRADGRLYYTMKLVRGRTLAAALSYGPSLSERLRLLGHYADICHALAYAHSKGVVHRDIKPANVMVGEFGETVVLDWGIAKVRGEPDDTLPGARIQAEGGHTVVGTVMGTPAYMSPEQADGHVDVDERSDTWSLGAVLFEILTGQRPYGDLTVEDTIAALRKGAPRRVRDIAPDVPQDLAAIADKALSYDPAARYPTARELAEDIDAWRSGAKVGAHEYGSLELLQRFVARHRTTVTVAAVSTVLLLAIVALSWRQVVAQRDRAVGAEQIARRHLGDALVDKSLVALREEDLQAAELFAAGALHISEDPDARGVLAQLAALWRPSLGASIPVEGDPAVLAWSPDGATIAALGKEELVVYDIATALPRWRVALATDKPRSLRWSVDSQRLATAGNDGTISIWDAVGGEEIRRLPSVGADAHAFAIEFGADGSVYGGYKRGPHAAGLARWSADTGERLAWRDDEHIRNSLQRSPDGLTILAGSSHGVEIFDAATLEPRMNAPTLLFSADWTADGRQVVGADGEGKLHVWDVSGAEPVRIATQSGGGGAGLLEASPDGRFVLERRESGMVSLRETQLWRRLFRFHATDLRGWSFSPDGRRLAMRDNDGPIRMWELGDEPVGHRVQDPPRPANEVIYSRDGTRVMTWIAGEVDLWSLPSGRRVGGFDGQPTPMVAAALEDGRFALASGPTLRLLDADLNELARLDSAPLTWVVEDVARSSLIGLTQAGDLVEIDLVSGAQRTVSHEPDAPWVYLASGEPGTHILAVAPSDYMRVDVVTGAAIPIAPELTAQAYVWTTTKDDAQILFSMRDNTVVVYDTAAAAVLDRFSVGGSMGRRMDVSADGRRLAVGGADHVVRIFDLGSHALLATLRGHENRLQAVAFSPDGRWLTSTSWDETTCLWDLSVLETPPGDVLASSSSRYGLVLDGATVVAGP